MRIKRKRIEWAILAVAVIAIGVLAGAAPEGTTRLVSVQQLPDAMTTCTMDDFSAATSADANAVTPQEETLLAELQQDPQAAPQQRAGQRGGGGDIPGSNAGGGEGGEGGGFFGLPHTAEQIRVTEELRAKGARLPVRTIRDTAPSYSSVAVDVNSNEVIMTDNNLWSYRVFDRLAPTPATDTAVTPTKRVVSGDKTGIQFNNGLYVDPVNGDIYSVESDTGDKMVRFPRDANGDQSPISILHTPHRVYNIASDEVKQELFLTIEFPPRVMVYAKHAAGEDKPLRSIEGNDTGLDAPHGIAVDEKDRLLFVNTWGHHADFTKAGTGKWYPPAIKVFALDASGDAKPLRVITGDKTQLDWPGGMKFNPDNGDLYIANDIGGSVLVFANAPKAQGDVAPARVIHGPSTRLRNPTGVSLDRKNGELWVSNLGNSSATVYPLMADGDAAPLRVIRSAEESKRGVNFGRTAAVTYDPIRQEILVPN
jgi:6-phosphogluconolactonase (cycloisomerase 2 family)